MLEIDPDRCEGHGRCYAQAPDLFDADEEGWGIVLVPHPDGVVLEKARAAVASCPERAISLRGVSTPTE